MRTTTAAASAAPILVARSAAWALVAMLGVAFSFHHLTDPDLFQHIAVGRALLRHPGSLGISDFIDAYPGYSYVEDKWLACVVVALADAVAGLSGVMVYQIALCVGVAASWYAMQRLWGASRAVAVVGVALGLLTCTYRLEARPDTLSHALLAVTIALTALQRPRRWWLWVITGLFVIWINVHGYFVNGLLVLLTAAVAAALDDGRLRSPSEPLAPRDRSLVLVVGVAACLLHPQGWRALVSPVQQILLVGNASFHGGIQELEPVTRLFAGATPWQWLTLTLPALAGLAAGATGDRRSLALRQGLGAAAAFAWIVWPPPAMDALAYRLGMGSWIMAMIEVPTCLRERRLFPALLLAGFTILAIPAVRNLPLLTPASLIVLAPAWSALEQRLPSGRAARRLALGGLATLVIATAWLRLSDRLNSDRVRAPIRTGWGIDADRFPVAAVDFLSRHQPGGRLLNNFDIGGYLLYRLHPERRVFIAGNTSMYPLSFYEYYRTAVTGSSPNLQELAARHDVRTVVADLASRATPRLFAALVADPAWKLVFLDHAAVVFSKEEDSIDPPLDLERRVGELVTHDVTSPALPRWLGGQALTFPAGNLADFLQTIGRPDLALRVAEPLWPDAPSEALATMIATAAMQSGGLRSRVAWLDDVQRRYPSSETLAMLLFVSLADEANALLTTGALDDAGRRLDRMRTLRPEACGPYLGLAKIAVLHGDAATARSMVAAALHRDTDATCRRSMQSDPSLAALL